jgi:antitoxin VapB
MALSIKNDSTERLARQIASETGESLTQAIHEALRERWERPRAGRCSRVLTSQFEVCCGGWMPCPLSTRGLKTKFKYDEHGMPR